jgi:hypothetical protein
MAERAHFLGPSFRGHSLTMLERIAAVCGIGLKLHAEKKPNFDREVALAQASRSVPTPAKGGTCPRSKSREGRNSVAHRASGGKADIEVA